MGVESASETEKTLNWDNAQKLVTDLKKQGYHPELGRVLFQVCPTRLGAMLGIGAVCSVMAGIFAFMVIGIALQTPGVGSPSFAIATSVGGSLAATTLAIFVIYSVHKFVTRNKKIEEDTKRQDPIYLTRILRRDIEFSKKKAATEGKNALAIQSHIKHLEAGILPTEVNKKAIEGYTKLEPATTLTWEQAEKIANDPEASALTPRLTRVFREASAVDFFFSETLQKLVCPITFLGLGVGLMFLGFQADPFMLSGIVLSTVASTALIAIVLHSVAKVAKNKQKVEEDRKSETRAYLAEILRRDLTVLNRGIRQNTESAARYRELENSITTSIKIGEG